MTDTCNYPDCKCPFDMMPDWPCCLGLPQKDKETKEDKDD